MKTQLQNTFWCPVYSFSSIQLSALGLYLSRGRPHWSHPSSRRVMPQTRLTTGRKQWASPSAGCMLASWFSAWSTSQSSMICGLLLRQATGQSTAPSIRPLFCNMSLTSTDASRLRCTSILWTCSLPMIGCNGLCYGTFFGGWGCTARCWVLCSLYMTTACCS